MASKTKKLKVTLTKSPIAIQPTHKQCIKGLGLRKMHHSVVMEDNPCVRGMLNKVGYLLSIEEISQ